MISFENFVLSYTYIVKEGLWLNNFGILFLGYILYNLVLLRLRFSATRVLSGSCATRNDEPLSGAWLPAAKDDLTKCTMKHSKGKLVRVFEYKALRSALRPLSTLFFTNSQGRMSTLCLPRKFVFFPLLSLFNTFP